MTIYHYRIGSGPHLVLLHGWAMQSDCWQTIWPELACNYTVHLIDMPGFGRSYAEPVSTTLTDYVQQLLAVLPEQAIYLGWSFGGLVAIAIAQDYPQRVSQLLTIGSTPRFIASNDWQGVNPQKFQYFYNSIETQLQQGLRKFINMILVEPQAQQQYATILEQQIVQWGTPDLNKLLTVLKILQASDLRNNMARILCPSLHCAGELDPLAPTNAIFPLQRIAGAGHVPQLTHSAKLLEILRSFLHVQ